MNDGVYRVPRRCLQRVPSIKTHGKAKGDSGILHTAVGNAAFPAVLVNAQADTLGGWIKLPVRERYPRGAWNSGYCMSTVQTIGSQCKRQDTNAGDQHRPPTTT